MLLKLVRKVCMYKQLRTVGNASCPEMNSDYTERRHEIAHRLLLC